MREELEQLDQDNARRLDKLEAALLDHVAICTRQKEQIEELVEFVHAVNASLRVANMIRTSVIWVAGFVGAVYALWRQVKGQ